ncbi:hypothetical protein E4U41_005308, partial [Claviceps citrina]
MMHSTKRSGHPRASSSSSSSSTSSSSASASASAWPNTPPPPCLIHRLFQAAQTELAIDSGSSSSSSSSSSSPRQHGHDGRLPRSPAASSPSSSRRPSHEDEAQSMSDTLVVPLDEQILDETYDRHSRTFHMVLLDPSYRVFVSRHGHGSLLYKIARRTLVVVGDPMCSPASMRLVLDDLRQFRHARGLRLAFMGVSDSFLDFARGQGWTTGFR